jgi:hypothetical protein
MQRSKKFSIADCAEIFFHNARRAQKTEWQAPSSNWIERKNRMSAQAQRFDDKKSARRRREEFFVKDERGWAGQHGQRPANEEEKFFESPMKDKAKENSARPQMPRGKQSSHSHSRMKEHRAGRNRPEDQAGGPEHSGGDAREDRNP